MIYKKLSYPELSSEVQLSSFTASNGTTEVHAMISTHDRFANAPSQYANIEKTLAKLAIEAELSNCSLVWKRYFVSDAANHAPLLPQNELAAISIVQQPALDGSKVVVWAYFVENAKLQKDADGALVMESSKYKHLYHTQFHSHEENEYQQTESLFNNYSTQLAKHNCNLLNHAIRTWIYVQGVDTHYADMVTARKLYFENEGLTDQTHYLASTGIEGRYIHPETIVLMDAYSIANIDPKQVWYLQGASHLNPTCEYGVTFERATAVDYADRRHIFVSGTASIDNKGDIVHLLQIDKQIERTFENIEVLLNEGEAQMNDIAQMIVYLRDTADYELVNTYLDKHYPHTPRVVVWAPVCRPGWLIEIECIAITEIRKAEFEKF